MLPAIFGPDHGSPGAYELAAHLLETAGLADKLGAYPRQLSAGQQQRVVVARALVNQPELLLADEPTSNLDEETEREIMDLFGKIHATTGLTILLVTHTAQLASYGSRALEMAGGTIRVERAATTLKRCPSFHPRGTRVKAAGPTRTHRTTLGEDGSRLTAIIPSGASATNGYDF